MASHNKKVAKDKEETKQPRVPHTRDQVLEQLQLAGFQVDSFPDSMLALFAAMWGVRGDLQNIEDAIDNVGGLIEEYCFEE